MPVPLIRMLLGAADTNCTALGGAASTVIEPLAVTVEPPTTAVAVITSFCAQPRAEYVADAEPLIELAGLGVMLELD